MNEKTAYRELFVKRIGTTADSYMITTDLINIFPINSNVLLDKNNIIPTKKTNYITIPKILSPEIPNFTIVEGTFMNKQNNTIEHNNNNILGMNSAFYCKINTIQIPIIKCSQEFLQFFGCIIINEGDVLKLNNNTEMPFFRVKIGKDYKSNYLLKKGLGDGFYIEVHDTPHIHQPLNSDAEGYLVLAKKQENILLLSKVKIPFGKALYIPPNIYHNDSLLIGDYNVLYTKTNNYTTYLFKTYDEKIVNII